MEENRKKTDEDSERRKNRQSAMLKSWKKSGCTKLNEWKK